MGGRDETIAIVLEDTGIRKALRFLEWFRFNIPATTTAIGVALLAGLVAVQLYLLLGPLDWPAWMLPYFSVLTAGWVVAAVVMVVGRSLPIVQLGWALGAFLSSVYFVIYVVSRGLGLPGAPYLRGWWDFTAGTFGMAFAVGFLGLHLAILSGVMIAHPQRRQWHD